ncbi:MAG TPA: Crp/Fnr family transcriptional regulator [Terriglobales bacterium]|nr:Crp/Fnr family transcriptional regulator [Terriglobales bacterium]
MLIQLGAVKGRGGVEPGTPGRGARSRQDAAVQGPQFPILVQTDSAKPEELAGPPRRGNRSQEFGASVDPLYLFSCGVLWHQQRDASAGWELIQYLRSPDRDARAIAAAVLAKTEHARLLVRDLRRARAHVSKPAIRKVGRPDGQVPGKVSAMNTPYGLEIVESCLSCKLRKDHWFCGLSPDVLKLLSAASHLSTYPGGAVLFVEGQMPRGAFVLCSGKAKLSTTSREGKVLILKIAEAGEVLGLSAVIAGEPFELTAETAGPCQVNFVEREALIRMMEKNGEFGLHASQALSREFQSAYRDIHDLVLARSSAGKLARLLLSWTPIREKFEPPEIRVRASLTHEEMAQMIGSSRETVTRLLSDLKKKEFIRLDGSTLVIRNRTALEALAA